ncbi:predicted protein [Histoplasma mississippiense (nom. inval.)]|uniref:predicted protein n=1 Tax=Ajellomyces capsulatus (strain NAm1 / WU24) TaxID=2059318 RepID=UPI000157CC54|nr:predicted protein [Histoplasma mississippiense (nom. inval.)]EDN10078.1 predicted protein [Histoplasma mississippiense (nom. inval.)]
MIDIVQPAQATTFHASVRITSMIVDLAAVNELKAGLGNEADYEQFALKKRFASV